MMPERDRPIPTVTTTNRRFFEEAARGRLALQRCAQCGAVIYFPRVACPRCLATGDLEWITASGRGIVYSFALVHRPQHPAFFDRVPIILAAVKLGEGPIMISALDGLAADEVCIGMPVEMTPEPFGPGLAMPKFRPSGAAA